MESFPQRSDPTFTNRAAVQLSRVGFWQKRTSFSAAIAANDPKGKLVGW